MPMMCKVHNSTYRVLNQKLLFTLDLYYRNGSQLLKDQEKMHVDSIQFISDLTKF